MEPRTSEVLQALVGRLDGDRISLGDIDAALQDRAFGLLMLVFALPNTLPISIPGVSGVLGTPILLLAVQLLMGYRRPWLPVWMSRRSFPRASFVRVTDRTVPWLERLERLLRPRLCALTGRTAERFLIGGAAVVLAAALALPIPFGNTLPALALTFLSLGLLERDGAAVLVGLSIGLAALGVAGAVLTGGWAALQAVAG